MTATCTSTIRRRATGVALAAAAVAVVAGCSVGTRTTDTVGAVPAPTVPSASPSVAPGVRVVLRFGEHAAAATLVDTPAARELAGMLPLTVELSDAWTQAKSGRLPHPVPVEGAARSLKPTPGGIYYWPDTAALTVYYDDLGQSVPPPGLIRLGAIDTGLDAIADAGRHITIRVDRAAETRP